MPESEIIKELEMLIQKNRKWDHSQLLSQCSDFGLGISELHHQVLLCPRLLLLLLLDMSREAARLWTIVYADQALLLLHELCYSLQGDVLFLSTRIYLMQRKVKYRTSK